MGSPRDDHDSEDTEEQRERYGELLQELRVVIPGVEVLFAFLLTTVFAQRFQELDRIGLAGFTAALLATALAGIAFMTPTAYHRLTDVDRRHRIRVAVVLQLAGMILVGVATSTAMFVVVRMYYSTTAGLLIGGVTAAAWIGLWYGLPALAGGLRDPRD